jgi:hypothetical protein
MTNGLGREIGLLRVVAQNLVSRPAPETQITQEYLRVDLPIDNNDVENRIRPVTLSAGPTGSSPDHFAPARAPRRS